MTTSLRPHPPAAIDTPAYQAFLTLRVGFVVAPILFGLDKVTNLLTDWTQDPAAEPLLDTPRRVAASYAELLTPAPVTRTAFPNDEGYAELVLTRAIPFASRGRVCALTSALHGLVRSDPRSRQESSLSPGSAGDGPHRSAAVK
jgi:hypothetical protein